MKRALGTVVRGIRTPIIKRGDDICQIVVDAVLDASKQEGYVICERDIIGITESLVARAQGNYATTAEIAADIGAKFPASFGVVFPILSRNRFYILLKAMAMTGREIHLQLSYPDDEVGNQLMTLDALDERKINPYSFVMDEAKYRQLFGEDVCHPFTGIDYVKLYKSAGENITFHFANDPREILKHTKDVLVASVHSRARTKRILREAGGERIYGLDDVLQAPVGESGYNEVYGLLGSNTATADEVKLFPRNGQYYVERIQEMLKEATGKTVEVMIYGDGAFKDPIGGIWELADPVVSPAHTSGLQGTPNEIKIKFLADTEFSKLDGQEAIHAMREKIAAKDEKNLDDAASLGTTPRRITDLLGSLCDLTTGSGDKGTPVVHIQGYFDNFASE